MVPVGGWDDCGVFTTVAAKVMVCPLVAGFALDANVVVVVVVAGWITSFNTALVDDAELGVAPYTAVIVCVPIGSVEMDSVDISPEVRVPAPSTVVPSRKRTCPDGIPCAPWTVAVKVMFCP